MESNSFIRSIDDLGRVAIPKAIRQTIGIRGGDPLRIYATDSGVFLHKYIPPTKSKAAFAQDWLEDNALLMRAVSAEFSIKDRTVNCEIISSHYRLAGTATAAPEDTFIPAVGMVIAFCRASSRTVPQELLKD